MGKLSLLNFRKATQIILIFTLLAVFMPPVNMVKASSVDKASLSAPFCQCVVYIKNKFKLSGSAGQAKNMGPFLQSRGFVKLTVPRPGEVIIMQPGFHVKDSAGHVAIIQTVTTVWVNGVESWKIQVRGANQPGSRWTESNCNNVSYWSFTSPKTDKRATYYGKK
ncbi:MAG: hypothetical protein JNK32_07230 [Anaerolineales bacterium]|nr:hypothetical protein [Anaerolineales bacterium]